jgi:ribose transport system ATP-binding protein
VTVLRDGRKVTTELVADTTPAALVHNIVGRALSNLFIRPAESSGSAVLRVDALVARDVGPITFEVAAGEILGLVGLRGAGHDVVGRAIFGDIPIASGSVSLGGRALAFSGPAARFIIGSVLFRASAARRASPRTSHSVKIFS